MPADQRHASHTNWDLIRDAVSGSESASTSLEVVVRRSWTSIYALIRASGRNPTDAADLTQGFVTDIFLSRRLLESAEEKRGRFRTLLQSAVRNYLTDVHRGQTAKKRGGNSIDCDFSKVEPLVADHSHDPSRAFSTRWAACLVRAAAEHAKTLLHESNNALAWTLFEERILKPAFSNENRPSLAALAKQYSLRSTGEVALHVTRAKRKFAEALLLEVTSTIEDPRDLQEEVRELLMLLDGR